MYKKHSSILSIQNYILSLIIFFSISSNAQELGEKQKALEGAVYNIITAYNDKDSEEINKYIHPSNGVYLLINENNVEYWLHRNNLCLIQECIAQLNLPVLYRQRLLEQKIFQDFTIQYINSDSQKRYDEGLYIDDKNLHVLTNMMRNVSIQERLKIDQKELRKIWRIESNSKRVKLSKITTSIWGDNFTFYLSYLNNNWYLSFIDFNN